MTLRQEYADILKLIDRLEAILKSEKKLISLIRKEMTEIAEQYGDDRRTTLIRAEESEDEKVAEEAPAPEEAVVFLTRAGQLRRVAPRVFEKMEMPATPEEGYRYLFRTQTDHTLLFFTDRGNCFPLSVGALSEQNKPRDRGVSLSGVLAGLEKDEQCVTLMLITPGSLAGMGSFIFYTKNGTVKRSEAADYDVKRAKANACGLKEGDRVIAVEAAEDNADILLISRRGQSIRFETEEVPVQGRASGGVRGIRLDEDDEVVLATQILNTDQVLLFTERGYGKRLMGALFDKQSRGGKGCRAVAFNKTGSTGTYVAACARIQGTRPFTVRQSGDLMTTLQSDELPCQALSDKGKPIVMALMNDVVEELIL